MDIIENAVAQFPGTPPDQWCEMNGAAVHRDAVIGPNAVIKGGTIKGGTIKGGTIKGGTIEGGTIKGGTIWGGTIEGGTIWGGTIWGGTIKGDLPYICGLLPHPLNISGPGTVTIGCKTHTITEWERKLETVARENNVSMPLAKQCLAIVKQWFVDNPNVVTTTESEGV